MTPDLPTALLAHSFIFSFLSTQPAIPQNCKVGDLPFNVWLPHEIKILQSPKQQ